MLNPWWVRSHTAVRSLRHPLLPMVTACSCGSGPQPDELMCITTAAIRLTQAHAIGAVAVAADIVLHDELLRGVTGCGAWLASWATHTNLPPAQRGVLPRVEEQSWPPDPFPSTFAKTLSDLEMPRFCRRYPALLTTLMKQMLDLVEVNTVRICLPTLLPPCSRCVPLHRRCTG